MDKDRRFFAVESSSGNTIANSYLPEETPQNIPTILKYNANIPKLSGLYILDSIGVDTNKII